MVSKFATEPARARCSKAVPRRQTSSGVIQFELEGSVAATVYSPRPQLHWTIQASSSRMIFVVVREKRFSRNSNPLLLQILLVT